MRLRLPDNICSEQDVQTLLLEVRTYAKWFSQHAIKKRLKVHAAADKPDISPATKELLHDWDVQKPLSTASLDELITALDQFKETAPRMTITLASPPPPGLKKKLTGWCRKNVAPDVLVSFQFNSELLGGMVIRYGSHIFDWSFRRQLLAARESFPEHLHRV